jgi:thymidylate kinase
MVDRFHLSTIAYQWQHRGKRYDFRWLEERLVPLGFRLVFCHRSADSFQSARERRLQVSGNPRQYDNLEVFIREQALLHELVLESQLPSFTVDVSDNDVARAVEDIAGWLDTTGGLYAP